MAELRDPLAAGGPPARRRAGPRTSTSAAPALRASIESDGTPEGTHVWLPDGTELTQAQRITWELDASTGQAVLTIQLGLVGLTGTGRLDVQPGPTPSPARTPPPTTRRTT